MSTNTAANLQKRIRTALKHLADQTDDTRISEEFQRYAQAMS